MLSIKLFISQKQDKERWRILVKIGEKNLGMIDRAIRVIIGILLIVVFALNMVPLPWSYIVLIIGVVVLITGIVGTCVLYFLMGWNTIKKK